MRMFQCLRNCFIDLLYVISQFKSLKLTENTAAAANHVKNCPFGCYKNVKEIFENALALWS